MQIPNPTNQQNRSIHHKIKALVTSGVESNKPDEMARLVETNHKEEEEEKTTPQVSGFCNKANYLSIESTVIGNEQINVTQKNDKQA
ncbi:hypothetical protein BLOT_009518 [Blomia tropicalis]|nr:hypothetical protein BLOT_009518 [Blomia tropicalis]